MSERHGSKEFYSLLEAMANLHDRKSHDYASNENPFGNYHFAGLVSSLFSHAPHDAGFAGRLAEKIYRLANLEAQHKTPKNESIEDTEEDICVITILWMASRREERRRGNPLTHELLDLITLMPDSQTQEIMDYITSLRETRNTQKFRNQHDLGCPGLYNAIPREFCTCADKENKYFEDESFQSRECRSDESNQLQQP